MVNILCKCGRDIILPGTKRCYTYCNSDSVYCFIKSCILPQKRGKIVCEHHETKWQAAQMMGIKWNAFLGMY